VSGEWAEHQETEAWDQFFMGSENCFGLNAVILVVIKAATYELGLYAGD
jgi:hypothetical protein